MTTEQDLYNAAIPNLPSNKHRIKWEIRPSLFLQAF